ncbi:glycine--tRNA ligase subunit beta [Metallumcola ferriviriculae]|uniref:Glycine--tRNA ligase beta subunit n=1 Tax=Metallumcola ferriviriculae TaxID=3039180 RepID=A0AAU0UM69_9FIRM|nr:glycine--tRNA ligase subunit beta [Desulfitibacteraceae bacterium MK1]
MTRNLLLEIGTEEIPARFMDNTLSQFKDYAIKMLSDARLGYTSINTYGTPRRLTLLVSELAERQEDVSKEAKGPSRKVAFDDQGNPTKAAMGFAKGQGVDVTELMVRKTDQGEYVFATVKSEGKKSAEILPAILKELILSLNFPKPMRWAYQELRFARPIRWLAALFGSEVLDFELAEVITGRHSRGHRFLGGQISLESADDYLSKMEEQYVIVDQERRREMIWQQIQKLAAAENGIVEENAELLEEVVYLLEYPTALCGSFEEKYLQLPDEVLITPMQEHQRYFPVKDKEGKLLNKFITVRNGTGEHLDVVTAGNEKVLKARLADAEFFYREDVKEPLEAKVPALKDVVFQAQLGTIYEKVERIEALSQYFSDVAAPGDKEAVLRTAHLAKADLVSHMVYEFPELQGIMGGYYAASHGEAEQIAKGISEHWQPRFAGDQLPETINGTMVSLADKMDTIVGCFGIGIQPTGSQDPYALRRQAMGICLIILDRGLTVSLENMVEKAYNLYGDKLSKSLAEVQENVLKFFRQRMENIFQEQESLRYDVVEAVLAAGYDSPADALKRAKALDNFRQDEQFEALTTAFKRAANLVEKAETAGQVNEDLLAEAAEKDLWQAIVKVEERLERTDDYYNALLEIAGLRQPVDEFFEQLMVMTDDQEVRENRLALLRHIRDLLVGKTGIRLELIN